MRRFFTRFLHKGSSRGFFTEVLHNRFARGFSHGGSPTAVLLRFYTIVLPRCYTMVLPTKGSAFATVLWGNLRQLNHLRTALENYNVENPCGTSVENPRANDCGEPS
jgi:hypothetical protein